MAVSYFLGCRSGISKSKGEWFGCITILCLNQYNQWASVAYWASDKDTYDLLTDGLSIGAPVQLVLRAGDLKVVDIHVYDNIPALPLSPPD